MNHNPGKKTGPLGPPARPPQPNLEPVISQLQLDYKKLHAQVSKLQGDAEVTSLALLAEKQARQHCEIAIGCGMAVIYFLHLRIDCVWPQE